MCISLISLLGGMFTIHIQINSNWITKWNQDGYHRQVTSQHNTGVKNIFSFTNATCKCGRDENRRRENVRILLIEKRKKEKSCQGNVQMWTRIFNDFKRKQNIKERLCNDLDKNFHRKLRKHSGELPRRQKV